MPAISGLGGFAHIPDDDHLLDDALAPGATGGTDHASDTARRTLAGDAGALRDPGTRVTVGVGGNLAGGLPPSDPAGALRPGGAAGGVDLSVTRPIGPGRADEVGTVTAGVRVGAAATVTSTGVDRAAALVTDAEALGKRAGAVYGEITPILRELQDSPTVARLREISTLAKAGRATAQDLAEAHSLVGKLETDLQRAHEVLERMPALLGELDGLVGRFEQGALRASAGATAGVFLEQQLGARTPTLRVGKHRFDAAFAVHLMQPTPIPDAARRQMAGVDQLLRIESAAVSVKAYVDVTVNGMQTLRDELRGIAGDVQSLSDSAASGAAMAGAASLDPIGTLANAGKLADDVDALASEVTARTESISDRADRIVDKVDVTIDTGVEVSQPNPRGLGVGLDEASVRWRWNPSQSFEVAVRAYAEHIVGSLPGRTDRLRADLDAGCLNLVGSRNENLYNTFFPRLFGVDAAASFGRNTNTRTDVMVGMSTDGRAVTAHAGLVQYLGQRFAVRLGLVNPDLTRRSDITLLPSAGIDLGLGPRANPGAVRLGLSGGAALNLNPTGGSGPTVTGGQGTLGLTINF